MPEPIGCGRQIEVGEFETWGPVDIEDYRITGLCLNCQNRIYVEQVEEERPMMDNLYDVYEPFREETEARHIFDTSTGRAPEDDWLD